MNKKTEYELLKLVAKEKGFEVCNENINLDEYPYVYKKSLFDENELLGYSENDNYSCTFTEAIDYIMNYKKLPETWEEFINNDSNRDIYQIGLNKVNTVNKRLGVLFMLETLRNFYNDNWIPDWCDKEYKFVLRRQENSIKLDCCHFSHQHLYFKTKELAKEFLKNFEDLIKIYFEL